MGALSVWQRHYPEGAKVAALPAVVRGSPGEGGAFSMERANVILRAARARRRFERGVPVVPLERADLLATLQRRRAQYMQTAPPPELPDWMTTEPEVLRIASPGTSFPCQCGRPAVARLRHKGAGIFTISAVTGSMCCSHVVPELEETE